MEALSKWVGKIPADVLQDMPVIAPMLAKLGYDPYANPPNYGKPDQKVVENTRRVRHFCVWFVDQVKVSSAEKDSSNLFPILSNTLLAAEGKTP